MLHAPLRLLLTATVCMGAVGIKSTHGADAGDTAVTFERDVRPIFKTHCFQCHGEANVREGALDLRLRRWMVEGGDSGPAITPGDPAGSYLLDRIRDGEMPPGEGAHLTAGEIAAIERWVAAGAPTARAEPEQLSGELRITEEEREFWSFQPIRRPAPPAVATSEDASADPSAPSHPLVRNPIDAFLLQRLQHEGLSFSPPADRRTLIRRATFDLHGLPPTPEEVDAFLADARPDAYERLIDRLLQSPRYGQRWGRHWLDVAGYADSEGYNEADTPRPHAYHYRDYVIDALNDDKPFDQFIVEQLAGDELLSPPYQNLRPEQAEKLIATGFLRMAPDGTGTRNDDPLVARNAVITETVKIVTSSLLGLTVGCAECHDHRFDPILQRDYYRLRAVFEPALDWQKWREPRGRQISMLSDAERAQAQQIEDQAKQVEAELTAKLVELRDWVFDQEVQQLPPELQSEARAAGLAWQRDPKQLSEQQNRLLETYPTLKIAPTQQRLNLFLAKYDRQDELKQLVDQNKLRADTVRAGKPEERFIRAMTETPGTVPVTRIFLRGDHTNLGDPTGPGDLTVLGTTPIDFSEDDPSLPTTGRRLALARRLTDPRHPLVARVLVNRFWMHHFGRGIVATPEDFGTQGQRPTHPELLDWLASEFVAGQWSLKRLQRTMMTSTAYRQASAQRGEGQRVDAENRLYWRMPIRRLEAEAVRDAVLAVSGQMNSAVGGPPVPVVLDDAGQPVVAGDAVSADAMRRSVYVQVKRSAPAYFLDVFDSPQMEPNCTAREASTVATQSLLLMNNRFIIDQAEQFAQRVRAEAGNEPESQVRRAWRLAFGAEPADADVADVLQYLEQQTDLLQRRVPKAKSNTPDAQLQALASFCHVLLKANGFLYID